MSLQDSKLVFLQEAPKAVITELPPSTTKNQLFLWANTKGSIISAAELDNPQSILLRLDQGQLPPQPLWAQDSALEESEFLWFFPHVDTKARRGDTVCPRSHTASQCSIRTVSSPSPTMRLNHAKWLLFVNCLTYKNKHFHIGCCAPPRAKPYASIW